MARASGPPHRCYRLRRLVRGQSLPVALSDRSAPAQERGRPAAAVATDGMCLNHPRALYAAMAAGWQIGLKARPT